MKLTSNYDLLARKYGDFSELIEYTNSKDSDYITGRKRVNLKLRNMMKINMSFQLLK